MGQWLVYLLINLSLSLSPHSSRRPQWPRSLAKVGPATSAALSWLVKTWSSWLGLERLRPPMDAPLGRPHGPSTAPAKFVQLRWKSDANGGLFRWRFSSSFLPRWVPVFLPGFGLVPNRRGPPLGNQEFGASNEEHPLTWVFGVMETGEKKSKLRLGETRRRHDTAPRQKHLPCYLATLWVTRLAKRFWKQQKQLKVNLKYINY